jgi:NADPH:quinone reductase-like Zn-dependent oxidoreductase
MKAIISTSEHTVELADVTKPSPSPDEVLVAVKAVCSNPTDCEQVSMALKHTETWIREET